MDFRINFLSRQHSSSPIITYINDVGMYFTSRLRYDRYDIEDVRRSAAPAVFCHDHTRSDPPTHLPAHNERLLLFVGRKGKHGRRYVHAYSLHTEEQKTIQYSTHARRSTTCIHTYTQPRSFTICRHQRRPCCRWVCLPPPQRALLGRLPPPPAPPLCTPPPVVAHQMCRVSSKRRRRTRLKRRNDRNGGKKTRA